MEVLYLDNKIIVCVKPAGVLSTDEPGGMPSLLRAALGDDTAPVYTVHRLDAAVSGVMVYARTRHAAADPDAAATAANAPGASASPGAAAAGTETGSGGLPAPPALDMPTVRSGAYDYIGYLDFPGYDLTMPVAATWSFPAMEISPCRHTGSVYNDNLVVAGHNYKTEFDVLFRLEAGDTVTFTDVDGNVFTYTVREFASVTPDDSDTVMNSGYALTMYTCNWDTSERVTVFCERTGGEIPGENA